MKIIKQRYFINFVLSINLLIIFFPSVVLGTTIFDNTSVPGRSLGGTFYPGDVSSVPLNPAGTAVVPNSQLVGSYFTLFGNARYNLVGYTDKIGKFYVSLLLTQLYRDGIEIRSTLSDDPVGTYSSKVGGIFTVAKPVRVAQLRNPVYLGISVKTVYYDIYNLKSNFAYGLDLGLYKTMFELGSTLKNRFAIDLGLSANNVINPIVTIGGITDTYPLEYRGTVITSVSLFPRYDLKKESLMYDELSLFLSYLIDSYTSSTRPGYSIGLEYRYDKYYLRTGYNPRYGKQYTLGLGAVIGDVGFNYAFTPVEDFYIHSLDVSYRWGQNTDEKVPDELSDFLEVKKKADRIVTRYLQQAQELVRNGDYEPAKSVVTKILPIVPNKKEVLELLTLCTNSVLAGKLNNINNEYTKLVSSRMFADAYDKVLDAVNLAPEDNGTQLLVSGLETENVPVAQLGMIKTVRNRFINQSNRTINIAISNNNYETAELEVKKLTVLDPTASNTVLRTKQVAEAKKKYVNSLVRKGTEFIRDGRYPESYLCLKEAYRVSKDDAVKSQLDSVLNKIPKPDLYDELYQKKLYLLAATYYATDDTSKSVKTFYELVDVNSTFARGDYFYDTLQETLIKSKLIKRELP